MTHPAEIAREHLVEALEACQAADDDSEAYTSLIQCLAKAQGRLFDAGQIDVDQTACRNLLRGGLDYLAQSLKLLQDVGAESTDTTVATKAVAASLKILHPVVHPEPDEGGQAESAESTAVAPAGVRNTFDVHVQTQLSMSTDHNFYLSFSENIEEGGIFVATFEPRPIGTKVVVNFKLPGDHRVAARGLVQWVREYNPLNLDTAPGMGVKFTDLEEKDRAAIEKYLDRREPSFYDDL